LTNELNLLEDKIEKIQKDDLEKLRSDHLRIEKAWNDL
jgi:hypothetical protein